ncbi:MAG: RsmE family RNA methyltransferase, partial [Chloroflexota bacterium]
GPEGQATVTCREGGRGSAPVRILLHPGSASISLSQALQASEPVTALALYVGPEGGFDAAEVEEARSQGLAVAHLGPRILRTETAGPVAAAMVLYALGEMERTAD